MHRGVHGSSQLLTTRLQRALTLPQVCYGLSLLLEVFCTPSINYICRQVQRQLWCNEAARCYHGRKLHREIQWSSTRTVSRMPLPFRAMSMICSLISGKRPL